MLQLVKIGGCIHVFDQDQERYVRSTARRVAQALGEKDSPGRKKLLKGILWEACKTKPCRCCSSPLRQKRTRDGHRVEKPKHIHYVPLV